MVQINKRAVLQAMKKEGIPSMAELSFAMSLDPSHLSKLLRGATFTSKTLGRFAKVLKCKPGSLVK